MASRAISLRLGQSGDAAGLALMSRDLIERGFGWSWTRARVARTMAGRDTATVVACSGREVIGFAMMYFGEQHAHLNLLAVRPAYQRRGIGRRLMAWLEESARAAGITGIYLEVRVNNQDARRFYRVLASRSSHCCPATMAGWKQRCGWRATCAIAPRHIPPEVCSTQRHEVGDEVPDDEWPQVARPQCKYTCGDRVQSVGEDFGCPALEVR